MINDNNEIDKLIQELEELIKFITIFEQKKIEIVKQIKELTNKKS